LAVVAVVVGAGVLVEAGETLVYWIVVAVIVVVIIIVGAEIVLTGYDTRVYVPYDFDNLVAVAVVVVRGSPSVPGETFVNEDDSIVVGPVVVLMGADFFLIGNETCL
jgi:hypothetical protein